MDKLNNTLLQVIFNQQPAHIFPDGTRKKGLGKIEMLLNP